MADPATDRNQPDRSSAETLKADERHAISAVVNSPSLQIPSSQARSHLSPAAATSSNEGPTAQTVREENVETPKPSDVPISQGFAGPTTHASAITSPPSAPTTTFQHAVPEPGNPIPASEPSRASMTLENIQAVASEQTEASVPPPEELQSSTSGPLNVVGGSYDSLIQHKNLETQDRRPPTSDPGVIRPTSLTNLSTASTAVSPDPNEHFGPLYPEQAFSALGPRRHPPPPPTRIGRTRSSHSPNWSLSASTDVETAHQTSLAGVRTAGHSPVSSPGIYGPSPKSPGHPTPRKHAASDEYRLDSHSSQASHLQAPIETHKLNKDVDPTTGRKILNNYELLEKLGSGQHGTVKLGRNNTNQELVAVKIVRRATKKRLGRTSDPGDMIKREVAILKKARHPHVVSLYEVIDDHEFAKVYLVLEYVERGEIVWRKIADRTIALFERQRLMKEQVDGYDETAARQTIEEFNTSVPARRQERAERLEEQKRIARDRLGSGHFKSQQGSADALWSLDDGGDPDHDLPMLDRLQHRDQRLSRADIHAAEYPRTLLHHTQATYHLENPPAMHYVYTDTSASQPSSKPGSQPPSVPPSQPSSQPASRPDTPSLEGTMYGPLSAHTRSDLEFQSLLKQVIEEDANAEWTEDDEDCKYVPCLTLMQCLEAFRDTVLGLEYLHYQGIIHRDIKPANLLWTREYRVKISDFGVSYLGKPIREDTNQEDTTSEAEKLDEDLELAKTVGTPAFYAPELCDPDLFDPNVHRKRPEITGAIDVWALGVTLYAMVYGRLPFYDGNEFRMYENIARNEVFIPRLRLRGVSHTDKSPSHENKRLDDVLEYEEVDDTLRDLLKRLLAKDCKQRISLKEVKHHPWVVSNIENKESWLDATDPSHQSQGKKIEISNEEVQDAIVGLTLFDRVKENFSRLGSVIRGRSSRKRAESNTKEVKAPPSTSKVRDVRRASLRGDEQIFAALKQSREPDHPLSHSVAHSETKNSRSSLLAESGEDRPKSALEGPMSNRPNLAERSMTTADSMKTVTARDQPTRTTILPSKASSSAEDMASATAAPDYNSSSSSLGGFFGGAGRRLAHSFRSRERGASRQSPSQSSRSSSVDATALALDEGHASVLGSSSAVASPSLGFSSAVAQGHLDPPPALREEGEGEYRLPSENSCDSISQPHSRHSLVSSQSRYTRGATAGGHRRSVSYAPETASPPTREDVALYNQSQQRPVSAAESSFAAADSTFAGSVAAVSSSSDMITTATSRESMAAHSREASELSGVSSLSDGSRLPGMGMGKHAVGNVGGAEGITMGTVKMDEEDDGGSSSEDEGLAMA